MKSWQRTSDSTPTYFNKFCGGKENEIFISILVCVIYLKSGRQCEICFRDIEPYETFVFAWKSQIIAVKVRVCVWLLLVGTA